MLKLALIRHAKSSWENSALDDMVRPLNQKGHENTILMGNYLLQQRFHPKQIISSPATRALHTAINLSSWIGYNKNKIEEITIGMFDGTHLKICGDDIPQDLKDYEIIEEIVFKEEVK